MERFLTNRALRNILKLVFSRRLIYFCISRLACYYLFCHINCLLNETAYCIIFQESVFICSCSVSAPTALINHTSSVICPPLYFLFLHGMHAVNPCIVAWLFVRLMHSQKWGANPISVRWVSLQLQVPSKCILSACDTESLSGGSHGRSSWSQRG